jgi:ABC-type Fe3+-siderophore transport system permease subunit
MVEPFVDNQEQKAKDLAIASLAVSVSSIFMTAGLLSFIGAIIGHIAWGRLKSVGNTSHTGFALAGIIVGYAATAIISLILFAVIAYFATDPTTWY